MGAYIGFSIQNRYTNYGGLDIQTDRSMAQHVAHYLEVAVHNGVFRPGEILSETRLAEELGVSRTPVREAITRLQGIGLFERIPGRYGIRVRPMSLDRALEIVEVRQILETASVEMACERASEESLRQLSNLLDKGRRQLDAGELLSWKKEGWGFHASIISLAGNAILGEVAEQLHERMRSLIVSSPPSREREESSYIDHYELVQAIRAKEVERAKEIVKRHIGRIRENLMNSSSSLRAEETAAYLRSIVERMHHS